MKNYPRERHGLTYSKEYTSYTSMIQRCEDQNCLIYKYYGGKGIKVYTEWRKSFLAFLSDMGTKPTSLHTLERIDNDGDYTPSNCRWATRKEQARNRSTNHILTAKGESLTLMEWCERLGCGHTTILQRLRMGWTEELAVTVPVRRCKRRRSHALDQRENQSDLHPPIGRV